jgi:hypothetical protein
MLSIDNLIRFSISEKLNKILYSVAEKTAKIKFKKCFEISKTFQNFVKQSTKQPNEK